MGGREEFANGDYKRICDQEVRLSCNRLLMLGARAKRAVGGGRGSPANHPALAPLINP